MSTQTPTIGLTLPIGTEHVSRQIINDNMTKIDTAFWSMNKATMRDVPFSIAVGDWASSGGNFVAEFSTAYVTATSKEFGFYDTNSMMQYAKAAIDLAKKPGGGAIVFTTSVIPTGTISGTLYVWDTDDGKIPVIIENTVVPIENGGTGASNLSGAKTNLGIADVESDVATLSDAIAKLNTPQGIYTSLANSTQQSISDNTFFEGNILYINSVYTLSSQRTAGAMYRFYKDANKTQLITFAKSAYGIAWDANGTVYPVLAHADANSYIESMKTMPAGTYYLNIQVNIN